MTQEFSWEGLAEELKRIKHTGKPLWADWFANDGGENYGIWLLRPNDPDTAEVRAAFSLIAARAIEKLGIPPIPTPKAMQHDPRWRLYCEVEEEIARQVGKTRDLSDAVPFGLCMVDHDAVDPCTRAWLELLRQESAAFRLTGSGTSTLKGKTYPSSSGTIRDVCGASAVYCMRRARDEIAARLINCAGQASSIAADIRAASPEAADGDMAVDLASGEPQVSQAATQPEPVDAKASTINATSEPTSPSARPDDDQPSGKTDPSNSNTPDSDRQHTNIAPFAPTVRRSRRTPDLKSSFERLDLFATLARELAAIKQDVTGYCTVAALKTKPPKFTLWDHIEETELKELVAGTPFAPKAYAGTLTLRHYGLTSRETLKKDRKKLRQAKKADLT